MHLTFAEVDSLDESRLREFLERRLPEGPYLDYKADYSNNKLSSAAAWVSGLSNSLGGLLLIGVIEPKRAASVDEQLIGLVGESEVRRSQLENSLRDSIDPRISGLLVQAVRLVSSRVVLAVYVPASIRGPHMCLSDNRIYARHSESTAKMTMHEIRESVLRTGTVLSSARDFISSRMAIAQTQFSAPNLLLQACPLSPWAIDRTLEKVETMTSRFNLSATAANLQHSFNVFDSIQYNVDGLVFQNHDESIRLNVFRDGYIEAFVRSIQLQEINSGQPYFDSQFHWEFIRAIQLAPLTEQACVAVESGTCYLECRHK